MFRFYFGLLSPTLLASRPHKPFEAGTRIVFFSTLLPPRAYSCYRRHGIILEPNAEDYGIFTWETKYESNAVMNHKQQREQAGRSLEVCMDLEQGWVKLKQVQVKDEEEQGQGEGQEEAEDPTSRRLTRRRLMKRNTQEEEDEEEEEEIDENGDGSEVALFLKDADLGGRGFEVKLRELGFDSVNSLLLPQAEVLNEKALTHESFGFSKVDLRRWRRALNKLTEEKQSEIEGMKKKLVEEKEAKERAKQLELEQKKQEEEKRMLELKIAEDKAARELVEGPPKWKLLEMEPEIMLKTIMQFQCPLKSAKNSAGDSLGIGYMISQTRYLFHI
jgi:hypothetical protein